MNPLKSGTLDLALLAALQEHPRGNLRRRIEQAT